MIIMGYDRLIGILYDTNNINKLTSEIKKLSLKGKLTVLSNDKIRRKVLGFKDTNLLTNILIDLPFDFRINFLSYVNLNEYNNQYDKVIINYLRQENYDDFDHSQFSSFKDLKDKKTLSTILKSLSSNKLKEIIIANYSKTISNYAFLEFSKKEENFELEAKIINNINDEILFLELKRRRLKDRDTTLRMEEFIKLDGDKQIGILSNSDLRRLENEIINIFHERNKHLNTQELSDLFKERLKKCNYIRLVELQTIISIIDDSTAEELMRLFFKYVLHFDFQVEPKYIKSMIYLFRKQSEKTAELYDVLKLNNYSVIYYLNTGIIDKKISQVYEKHITCNQYQKTNNKRINKIIKMCQKKYPDNYVDIIGYKMYYILGYDNTIELLNGKYGYIDDFYTLEKIFSKCDVKKVEFKPFDNSNEPCIDENLIQFLIGDKKDDNITIRRMLRGEIVLL